MLRTIEPADYPAFTRWSNDLEVELLGGGDPPRPRSAAGVARFFDQQAADGGHNFAIDVEGALIGQCALFHLDAVARTAELGITIGEREYWGRGFGRDAVSTLTGYGFRHLNLTRVWLNVLATNERALRSYGAAGFVEEGRLRRHVWSDGRHVDLVVMGVLRTEAVTGAA